jgi:hypothetical protein
VDVGFLDTFLACSSACSFLRFINSLASASSHSSQPPYSILSIPSIDAPKRTSKGFSNNPRIFQTVLGFCIGLPFHIITPLPTASLLGVELLPTMSFFNSSGFQDFVDTPATKAYIKERKESALKYSCDNIKADVRRYEREQKRSSFSS